MNKTNEFETGPAKIIEDYIEMLIEAYDLKELLTDEGLIKFKERLNHLVFISVSCLYTHGTTEVEAENENSMKDSVTN